MHIRILQSIYAITCVYVDENRLSPLGLETAGHVLSFVSRCRFESTDLLRAAQALEMAVRACLEPQVALEVVAGRDSRNGDGVPTIMALETDFRAGGHTGAPRVAARACSSAAEVFGLGVLFGKDHWMILENTTSVGILLCSGKTRKHRVGILLVQDKPPRETFVNLEFV